MKQLRWFLLTIGMMMSLSIVGCTGAASEKPSVQPGRFSVSQDDECAKLKKSVVELEREIAGAPSSANYVGRLQAELATARQGRASCEANGQ
jgi:hypothetical protein